MPDSSHLSQSGESSLLKDRRTESALLRVALFCLVACGLTQALDLSGHGRLMGLSAFFDMESESSFPNWYSMVLWFIAASKLWRVAATRSVDRGYWRSLAVLCAAISIDEITSLHENMDWSLGGYVPAKGVLYYQFVVPGAVIAAVAALLFSRFLKRLPRQVSTRLILAGAIFVFAQIVLEMIAGSWVYEHGGADFEKRSLINFMLSDAEEFLEMLAAIWMFRSAVDQSSRVVPAPVTKK